jgi:hypothetical protein
MLMPPTPIIAGNGPLPVVGYVMVGENVMVLAPSVTVMARVVPENVAVTDVGSGGIIPSSSDCNNEEISALRHVQSLVVTTLEPSANVNGSGSAVLL